MKKLLSVALLTGSLALSLNAGTLDECVAAYKAGALDRAESLCTQATKEDSKSYWANFWLCKTYLGKGEYKKALAPAQKLEKLAKTLQEYSLAYGNQGLVYSYLGDKKQELKYKLKSLEANRKIGDRGEISASLHNLGGYYLNIGNLEEAKKYLTEALEYKTDKISLRPEKNNKSAFRRLFMAFLSPMKQELYLKKFNFFAQFLHSFDTVKTQKNLTIFIQIFAIIHLHFYLKVNNCTS